MPDGLTIFAHRRSHRRWLERILADGGPFALVTVPEQATVAVADLTDGLEVLLTRLADYPKLPFVVCHEDDHDDRCRLVLRAGAAECIRLDADGSSLRAAVRRTARGTGPDGSPLVPRLELMERIFASTSDRSLDIAAQITEVLHLGCQRFEQETGAVCRISPAGTEILHSHGEPPVHRATPEVSLGSVVLTARQALGIADLGRSPWRTHPGAAGLHSYIGAPFAVEGEIVGTVEFSSRQPRSRPFRNRDLAFATALGEWVGSLLTRDRRMRELEILITRDHLTGLPNRNAILHRLEHSVRRAELADDYGFALLFIELGAVGGIDDPLSETPGNTVLAQVGHRIRAVVRPKDSVGRFAEDEFAVLVEDTDVDEARTVADRIVAVLSRPFYIGDRAVLVGASVGVAMGTTSDSARDVVIAADEALYTAKSAGHPIVTLASAAGRSD